MRCRVDLFCEDAAHESTGRALVRRCAELEGVDVTLRVPTARFGIPRLKSELEAFQQVLRHSGGTPDLLIVLVDGNAVGPAERRREIQSSLDDGLFPAHVFGIPDPAVERWLLADPHSFRQAFGQGPTATTGSSAELKHELVAALEAAGEIVTQGGTEFADDIIEAMDVERAARAVPSLGTFIGDVRHALRQHRLLNRP